MIIRHAVIDFADPMGKQYYPSEPTMAEGSFLDGVYAGDGQDLAAHIVIGSDAQTFRVNLYPLNVNLPQDRRLNAEERRVFINPDQKIKCFDCSLSHLGNDWKNYLNIVRGSQVQSSPRLTERYNSNRAKIHDLVADKMNGIFADKGLGNIKSRRFIALLRTYVLNCQQRQLNDDYTR